MKVNAVEYSGYLKDVGKRYARELGELPEDAQSALDSIILSIDQIDPQDSAPEKLRLLKALFSYRWALARVEQLVDVEQLGRLQTTFAEVTIHKALQAAWSEKIFQRLLSADAQDLRGNVPGLFVLGLGKLGGFDLNFSSDVDLIAFYDPETLPVLEMHGRMDVSVRVLKRMTQILSSVENGDFVWRVDWRLRPDASVTQIAMSTQAALDFYFFRSLPWHRLAMIKARPIAGDKLAGDRFLAELDPYVWRQNLDYRMVDEIFLLKEKINQEHPQLKLARLQNSHGLDDLQGFNLKLGSGGIREIEFIANALQLLWGGKKPAVQVTSTLSALAELSEEGLLDKDLSDELRIAYCFLRRVEDVIQIQENQQLHSLPDANQKLDHIVTLLSIDGVSSFYQELVKHRKIVHEAFEQLFCAHQSLQDEGADDVTAPTWIDELEPAQQFIWETWQNGFSNYAAEFSQYHLLKPLLLNLKEHLDSTGVDRNSAIVRIDGFLKKIPKGGQYLRLLAKHPQLSKDIVDPLFYSPHMTELLSQSPHIVDFLLEPLPPLEKDFDSEFVLQKKNIETRQERLRRFVNEQLYSSYLKLFRGEVGAIETQGNLTNLAEHVIDIGIQITCEDMHMEEPPIAILGMGKLGMAAMAPMSDLDLIFIADDAVDLEIANRYSRRFQNLMAMRTKEGLAYEMDTRLRPSGRSGPVTVSLNGFRDYHLNKAKNWEHIAMVPGRPIAGTAGMLVGVADVRSTVLTCKRDLTQFKLDAAKMLWRLREQRIGKSEQIFGDIKLRSGGLMELDYMTACNCLINPPAIEHTRLPYDQMMLEIWPKENAPALRSATIFWRKLQIWSRLLALDSQLFEQLPDNIQTPFLIDMGADSLAELGREIDRVSKFVRQQLDQLMSDIEPPESWDNWTELPVIWQGQ